MSMWNFLFGDAASVATSPESPPKSEPPKTMQHREETLAMLDSALRAERFEEATDLLMILTRHHSKVPNLGNAIVAALDVIAQKDKETAFKAGIRASGAAPYERKEIWETIGAKLVEICSDFPVEKRAEALREASIWVRSSGEVASTIHHTLYGLIDKLPEKEGIWIAKVLANKDSEDPVLERMAIDKWLELVRRQPVEAAAQICASAPNPYRGGLIASEQIDIVATAEWVRLAQQLPPEKAIFLARTVTFEDKRSPMDSAVSAVIKEARTRLPEPLPRASVDQFVRGLSAAKANAALVA